MGVDKEEVMITHKELYEKHLYYAKKDPAKYGEPITDYTKWLETCMPIPKSLTDKSSFPTQNMDVLVCYDGRWYPVVFLVDDQAFRNLDGSADKLMDIALDIMYWVPAPVTELSWRNTLAEELKEEL